MPKRTPKRSKRSKRSKQRGGLACLSPVCLLGPLAVAGVTGATHSMRTTTRVSETMVNGEREFKGKRTEVNGKKSKTLEIQLNLTKHKGKWVLKKNGKHLKTFKNLKEATQGYQKELKLCKQRGYRKSRVESSV
jgi:hypothetical protein